MREGTPIEVHLKKMKELVDKLRSVGAKSEEEDQVVTLLGSLPASFLTVVIALEARADVLSLDFVQQQLIHHERKSQIPAVKPESLQDSALVGSFRRKPQCWTCNKIGHVQRFCPKQKTYLH